MVETFQLLAANAAPRLVGAGLFLHWRDPPGEVKMWGLAQFDGESPIIYIAPYLSEESAYGVLLHECAHARDLLPSWRQAATPTAPLMKSDINPRSYFSQPREIAAESWAETWDQWAREHAYSNNPYSKLIALRNWR